MTFSIIDVILILAAGQGIFLLFFLLSKRNKNPNVNALLSVMLSIAILVLIGRLLRYRVTGNWYFFVATFIDTSIFIFGPLSYLLIRKMYFKEPSNRLRLWHFVPAGLHLLYFFWLLIQPAGGIRALYQNQDLKTVYLIIELAGLLSMIFYNLLSVRLWLRYEQQLKYVLSYENSLKRFTQGFLIFWGVFNSVWLLQFLIRTANLNLSQTIFARIAPYFTYINIWIAICIAIYFLSYASLRIPEVFQLPKNITKKQSSNRLSVAQIAQLKKRLEFFLVEEKIYLDPDLTRGKLAKKVAVSANDLSWMLNTVFKKTFYDYINHYRIEEVKEKIKKGEHKQITLLALAYDAGFKSKSTFNKVFKAETGMSPSVYAEAQKVA